MKAFDLSDQNTKMGHCFFVFVAQLCFFFVWRCKFQNMLMSKPTKSFEKNVQISIYSKIQKKNLKFESMFPACHSGALVNHNHPVAPSKKIEQKKSCRQPQMIPHKASVRVPVKTEKRKKESGSKKAGLIFPIGRILRFFFIFFFIYSIFVAKLSIPRYLV